MQEQETSEDEVALQAALDHLDARNARHLRGVMDTESGNPLGYSHALLRCGDDPNAAVYRYVHGREGGAGRVGAAASFPALPQRNLIRDLRLDTLALDGSSTFRFAGAPPTYHTHPLDELQAAGRVGGPWGRGNAEIRPHDGRDPPHQRLPFVREAISRYGGRRGPFVGEAIELIALAILTGLERGLDPGGPLRKLVEGLLTTGPVELEAELGAELADAHCHVWCAHAVDLEEPSRPPVALFYTVANCANGCPLCSPRESMRYEVEDNLQAAAQHYTVLTAVRLGLSPKSEAEPQKWYFASAQMLAQQLFSRAVVEGGTDMAELVAWSEAKAVGGAASANARKVRAKAILQAYVEKTGAADPAAVTEFLLEHLYDVPAVWKQSKHRDAFLAKAAEHFKEAERKARGGSKGGAR